MGVPGTSLDSTDTVWKKCENAFFYFMIFYEIFDIGSDGAWLFYTAYASDYKDKQTVCVFATILWVVNFIRFPLTTLGKIRLRESGNEQAIALRGMVYNARQYMFEDLPMLVMVIHVSVELGTFDEFAIASLVGNIGVLLGNISYGLYNASKAADIDGGGPCVMVLTFLPFTLCCPCFMACLPCLSVSTFMKTLLLKTHDNNSHVLLCLFGCFWGYMLTQL